MRFRATIEDVALFLRIIQSVEKLSRKCILWLREDQFDIICLGEIQVWSHINADVVFTDYRIQSNSDNRIAMEISLDALLQALRSGTSSSTSSPSEVIVKLAKKNDHAVLNFEISSQTRQSNKVQIAHDVRVKILKPADMDQFKEPLTPAGDVSIYLPPLSKLRSIVDRLAKIGSPTLGICATLEGDFRISLAVDEVRVDTHWKNCKIASIDDQEDGEGENKDEDKSQWHSVLISTKSFSQFLAAHVLASSSIAYIVQNHCLIMYVYIGDPEEAGGVLTYYIPAVIETID